MVYSRTLCGLLLFQHHHLQRTLLNKVQSASLIRVTLPKMSECHHGICKYIQNGCKYTVATTSPTALCMTRASIPYVASDILFPKTHNQNIIYSSYQQTGSKYNSGHRTNNWSKSSWLKKIYINQLRETSSLDDRVWQQTNCNGWYKWGGYTVREMTSTVGDSDVPQGNHRSKRKYAPN